MHFYESTSTICAPVEKVWSVLTDAASYALWDSGIESVDGTIAPDESITIHSTVNQGRAFPVKVTEFEPGSSMTWTGGMPIGLFTGVRTFTLTPADDGCTLFVMREEYHGPLVPVIWKSMPDLQASFDQFTAGLKMKAEQG